jgi:Ca-activated chloride channel homolog
MAHGSSGGIAEYAVMEEVVLSEVPADVTIAEIVMLLPEPTGDLYADVAPSPVVAVADQPVSTFSIDVDTAAYANVRRFLEEGRLPPPEAVRVEELVNYFPYDYMPPQDAQTPFATTVSVMPTPWNTGTQLVHIAIKGYDVVEAERPRANLVFLVDVSGSMDQADKLPLVIDSLRLLVDQLQPDDSIAIVTYAGNVRVALEPTPAAQKGRILSALENLRAGGSTAGAAGIVLAYDAARQAFVDGGVNRVILATDGDFNVGLSDPDTMQALIEHERDSGIHLSVLGFGRGNYNDLLMQRIAQHGNGNAAYIDSLREAKKVLVDELNGTLFTIANDVKIQVEFNPAQVAEYRLLGYETRLLAREDFNNDRIDAGEIGNGHAVTAIYEIVPAAGTYRWVDPLRYGTPEAEAASGAPGDELAFLRIRYKLPGEQVSKLIETPILAGDALSEIASASDDVRFAVAVAGWGELLRGDTRMGTWRIADALKLARGARGEDAPGYRAEFVQLADLSRVLAQAD